MAVCEGSRPDTVEPELSCLLSSQVVRDGYSQLQLPRVAQRGLGSSCGFPFGDEVTVLAFLISALSVPRTIRLGRRSDSIPRNIPIVFYLFVCDCLYWTILLTLLHLTRPRKPYPHTAAVPRWRRTTLTRALSPIQWILRISCHAARERAKLLLSSSSTSTSRFPGSPN